MRRRDATRQELAIRERSRARRRAGDHVRAHRRTGWTSTSIALYDARAPRAAAAGRHALQRRHGDPQRTGRARQGAGERVIVTNWRTGEQVTAAEFDDIIKSYEVGLGRARPRHGRRHAARGRPGRRRHAAHASRRRADARQGERVLFFRKDGIGVFERNGTKRRFGMRTERLERFVSDGRQRAVERERLPAARADHRPRRRAHPARARAHAARLRSPRASRAVRHESRSGASRLRPAVAGARSSCASPASGSGGRRSAWPWGRRRSEPCS